MPTSKLQRWLDLLAALLARNAPAPFVDLARDVPGYLGAQPDSVKRMFERDKRELRELGVPIVSVGDDGDEDTAYQLRRKDFYLPYLAIMSERGLQAPAKVDRYGYHALTSLVFESDELEAIREAANRVMQVGDPALAHDARHALQKLAFDLPIGATEGPNDDAAIVPPASRPDPTLLSQLGERIVEAYGLFFLGGHWYLAARDVEKNGIRNYRVSRMRQAKANASRAGTPDYEIPKTFVLREHARSRRAWEIGDNEGFEAAVMFPGSTGAAKAASSLGRPDDANPALRHFSVRRSDTFARWLMAFGGDAVPVAPPALVDEYTGLVNRTSVVYDGEAN